MSNNDANTYLAYTAASLSVLNIIDSVVGSSTWLSVLNAVGFGSLASYEYGIDNSIKLATSLGHATYSCASTAKSYVSHSIFGTKDKPVANAKMAEALAKMKEPAPAATPAPVAVVAEKEPARSLKK